MLLLLLCFALGADASDFPPPKEPYTLSWTGCPMVWPNEATRSLYKSAGNFEPSHMVGTRFALLRDQVFMAFPRYMDGVSATLVRSSLVTPSGEPSWEAFPSWEAQTKGDPKALQSVVDVVVESGPRECVWVLDTGVTESLKKPVVQCPPKVVGFDPATGRKLHSVDLSEYLTPRSRLQFLSVSCDPGQTTLFISDAGENAVIVHDVDKKTGYRAALPDEVKEGCLGGIGDILYIAAIKNKPGVSKLYLTYACGTGIYSLAVSDLRAGTTDGTLEVIAEAKPRKMIIIGSDAQKGVFYFRQDMEPNVYSWCVDQELTPENIKLIHNGDPTLLATNAVFDPLRGKVRILCSNIMDYLKGEMGVGTVQVLRAAEF